MILLDLDGGLREVLVAAQHHELGRTLDHILDIDAGLQAIVPTTEQLAATPAPDTPASEIIEVDGAVATLLMSLDTPIRLAIRNHPALDALAILFTLTHARLTARVHDLTIDLTRARDLTRNLARDLARDLTLALTHALTHALDRDLTRALDLDRALDLARHDFTTADLRGVDLTHVQLDGLCWSTTTQWPSEAWRDQALQDSTEIKPGIYEIRGGTTNVPTHIS